MSQHKARPQTSPSQQSSRRADFSSSSPIVEAWMQALSQSGQALDIARALGQGEDGESGHASSPQDGQAQDVRRASELAAGARQRQQRAPGSLTRRLDHLLRDPVGDEAERLERGRQIERLLSENAEQVGALERRWSQRSQELSVEIERFLLAQHRGEGSQGHDKLAPELRALNERIQQQHFDTASASPAAASSAAHVAAPRSHAAVEEDEEDELEWAWEDEEGLGVLAGGLGGVLAGAGLGALLGYSGILPGLSAATGAILGAGLGGILGGLGGDLLYPDEGNNVKVGGGWRVRAFEARHQEALIQLARSEKERMIKQAMPNKLRSLRASSQRDAFVQSAINTLVTWSEREPEKFEAFVPAWDYDEDLKGKRSWYIASDGRPWIENQKTEGTYEAGQGKIYLKTIDTLAITEDGYEEPVRKDLVGKLLNNLVHETQHRYDPESYLDGAGEIANSFIRFKREYKAFWVEYGGDHLLPGEQSPEDRPGHKVTVGDIWRKPPELEEDTVEGERWEAVHRTALYVLVMYNVKETAGSSDNSRSLLTLYEKSNEFKQEVERFINEFLENQDIQYANRLNSPAVGVLWDYVAERWPAAAAEPEHWSRLERLLGDLSPTETGQLRVSKPWRTLIDKQMTPEDSRRFWSSL